MIVRGERGGEEEGQRCQQPAPPAQSMTFCLRTLIRKQTPNRLSDDLAHDSQPARLDTTTMPSEMDDLLALVQPPAAAAEAVKNSKAPAAVPAELAGVDLSALTASDLALLGPLMKLLDLSPEDVAALASQDSAGGDDDDDCGSFEDVDSEDGEAADDDDDEQADEAALLAELATLEQAEKAAGSLEGNLDRLLARIEGLEGEIEPSEEAGQASAEKEEKEAKSRSDS